MGCKERSEESFGNTAFHLCFVRLLGPQHSYQNKYEVIRYLENLEATLTILMKSRKEGLHHEQLHSKVRKTTATHNDSGDDETHSY